jgi:hypothetical protein
VAGLEGLVEATLACGAGVGVAEFDAEKREGFFDFAPLVSETAAT